MRPQQDNQKRKKRKYLRHGSWMANMTEVYKKSAIV